MVKNVLSRRIRRDRTWNGESEQRRGNVAVWDHEIKIERISRVPSRIAQADIANILNPHRCEESIAYSVVTAAYVPITSDVNTEAAIRPRWERALNSFAQKNRAGASKMQESAAESPRTGRMELRAATRRKSARPLPLFGTVGSEISHKNRSVDRVISNTTRK